MHLRWSIRLKFQYTLVDFKKFIMSFVYALKGIYASLEEQNMRVHVLAMIVAISAAFYFQVSNLEWLAIILICALVLSLEAFNSALEALADSVQKEENPLIGKAKDMAAAAVLIAAIAAIFIAGIIFGDKIF